MLTHPFMSSDSHIIEPPDLWETRIDPKFRDRAPYLAREDATDQWYVDGNRKFGTFNVGQAGLRFETPEEIVYEGRYENVPLGGIDPHAHVQDMDLDGIMGGVLYPSMALTLYSVPDTDLLSAIFRAYNNWLADFCQPYPARLKGIAMLNEDNIREAVEELKRAAELGLAGALIATRSMFRRYNDPEYDLLWATAQDLQIPISLHTGCMRWRPQDNLINRLVDPTELTNKEYYTRNTIADMIFSGVFERFPNLRVGAIEFEMLWAPYFMGRLDNTYRERTVGQQIQRFASGKMPSDFFRSNMFVSFQEDDLGIQLRSTVGVDNLLWGSDYPHAESTFPRSREILERILQGIPEDEKAKIAGSNTAKLYRFN